MSSASFSADDRARLAEHGIDESEAARQLELLRNPPSHLVLDRPCTIGDGVEALDALHQERAVAAGRALVATGRVTKFVPASGAATRMFQGLATALAADLPSATDDGRRFVESLDAFPFAAELRGRAGIQGTPSDADAERRLLATLLREMRYAELPKGLIPFHNGTEPHTAFEDQLWEGTAYTRGEDGRSRMHFTVVPTARADFEGLLGQVRGAIGTAASATLDVSFSEQHPSTDTIAIDAQGQPFRTSDGRLLFRPAGHGALIDNLQKLSGDVVVIKNIDNILPSTRTTEVVRWKLVLLGVLAELQAFIAGALERSRQDGVTEGQLTALVGAIGARFGRVPRAGVIGRAALAAFVQASLDRPLRVVGVVRNEGEPGGAPFWVRASDGTVGKQIVESAQVDLTDAGQKRVFAASTHFNPVDIVCALRDPAGRPYDLARFVDPATAFIARKSSEGRALTALERPGLWNGAMAHWNTVCIEVPASTFAPVKTVFDLLRPQHQ